MSDYAIQFTLDYAKRDKNQCRIIEIFRITQVPDYAGSTVLLHTILTGPDYPIGTVGTVPTVPIG